MLVGEGSWKKSAGFRGSETADVVGRNASVYRRI
jgi:hypothetical protein